MADRTRSGLQTILATALGTSNVYFQPPPSFRMVYPCIVYRRSDINADFADNIPYIHTKQYEITVIDSNPDSLIPDKIAKLAQCSFERNYTADQLHHDVFRILY